MSIYPYTPYVYIIQHISGKLYIGSRCSKAPTKFSKNGCHPVELLKQNGYTTSSKIVKQLIKDGSIDDFRIVYIKTDFTSSAHNYETTFLMNIDDDILKECWLNISKNHAFTETKWTNNPMHNQTIVDIATSNCQDTMYRRYGVKSLLQVKEFKEKQQATCEATVLRVYGVANVFQLESVKQK